MGIETICTFANPFNLQHRHQKIVGTSTGAALGILSETTGPAVAMHEIVGHGLLGLKMTENYAPGQGPTYWIQGWDNLKAIGHAGSLKEGFIAFFDWITGYTHGGDFAGTTNIGNPSGPNSMGQAMGPDGHAAWISISGSLPMLAIDTMLTTTGMLLRKKKPTLGSMLVAMGLVDSSGNSAYPISAALMSSTKLHEEANHHDFANFAVHMSHILGVSAETVAIATAAIWTPIVPLAAFMTYLYTKSKAIEVVPDALAVKHWLLKAEKDPEIAKELERLNASFSEKEALNEILQKSSSSHQSLSIDEARKIQSYGLRLIAHILDSLPSDTLNKEKREILSQWNKNVAPDRLQKALTATAITGNLAAVTTKILEVFSNTIAPSLSSAVTALTYISPILVGTSVLSSAYQVYKDFTCPDAIVPKKAKWLSVARLIVNIACATFITIALFLPGLNVAFFSSLIIGSTINLILSFIRSRIIHKQFVLNQALRPEVSSVMSALWLNHQKQPQKTPMNRILKSWVDCVKQDSKFRLFFSKHLQENLQTDRPLQSHCKVQKRREQLL